MKSTAILTTAIASALFILAALLGDPTGILLFIGIPVFLIGIFILTALVSPWVQVGATRIARNLTGIWVLMALGGFVLSYSNSVRILRNTDHAFLGLFLTSGLFLPGLWSAGEPSLGLAGRDKVPTILGPLTILAFSMIPIVAMSLSPLNGGQVAGPLIPALFEVARYGFDGTIPAQMQPEVHYQILRNLGAPPREITVAMGATMTGLYCWSALALIAMIGRALPRGAWRWRFYYLAPLLVGCLLNLLGVNPSRGLWANDPKYVASYGPILLVTLLITIALFVVIRIDRQFDTAPPAEELP